MRTIKEIKDEFNTMLKNHDWTYEMSDDHRAYMAGLQESIAINKLIAEMSEAEPTGILATDMRNEYKSKRPVY